MLAAGLSPAQALATNKLQSVGGSFSASLYFIRRGAVNLNEQWLNIAMTLLGSVLGAILIQRLQADFLRQMLPLFLIAIGLWFLLMPRLGEVDRARRLQGLAFALVGGGAVGFYDGFSDRVQDLFMRWLSSRSAATTLPKRPPMPRSSTSPRTSAACCSLCSAAK